jgi:hypothetical protein
VSNVPEPTHEANKLLIIVTSLALMGAMGFGATKLFGASQRSVQAQAGTHPQLDQKVDQAMALAVPFRSVAYRCDSRTGLVVACLQGQNVCYGALADVYDGGGCADLREVGEGLQIPGSPLGFPRLSGWRCLDQLPDGGPFWHDCKSP